MIGIGVWQPRPAAFPEFVLSPSVQMEPRIYLKGRARRGPTWREAVLMHAVARLVLHPLINNIQTSWVQIGSEGAAFCIQGRGKGVGGTPVDESLTSACRSVSAQERPAQSM